MGQRHPVRGCPAAGSSPAASAERNAATASAGRQGGRIASAIVVRQCRRLVGHRSRFSTVRTVNPTVTKALWSSVVAGRSRDCHRAAAAAAATAARSGRRPTAGTGRSPPFRPMWNRPWWPGTARRAASPPSPTLRSASRRTTPGPRCAPATAPGRRVPGVSSPGAACTVAVRLPGNSCSARPGRAAASSYSTITDSGPNASSSSASPAAGQGIGRRHHECRCGPADTVVVHPHRTRNQRRHIAATGDRLPAPRISGGDAGRQRTVFADLRRGLDDDVGERRVGGHEQESRFGAQLPGRAGDTGDVALRDVRPGSPAVRPR